MSISIRPQDLPELRAEISQQMRDPRIIKRMWPKGAENHADTEEYLAACTDAADLFYVSDAMSDLAANAAESLERFALQAEDIPCANGIVIFDGRAPFETRYEDGCVDELHGITWYTHGPSILGMPITLPHRHDQTVSGARLAVDPAGAFSTSFGDAIEEILGTGNGPCSWDVFALLLSVWLLMAQPLARTSEVEPDRAARKRLRRAGHEPAPVRVIELRRPRTSSGHGDGDREYHHQWIVRGHWRQQWHPKRQVHRPVWIAPHIKGPEGAPLIGGEKVYALKR